VSEFTRGFLLGVATLAVVHGLIGFAAAAWRRWKLKRRLRRLR
jgi:hypothetical protein